MKFIDEVSFQIESGKGGPGCMSFRREKYLPRGGPDGGNGGKGGDVIFRVNTRLNTLMDLYHRRKLCAENGRPGDSQNKTGPAGNDLVVEVPPGTVIRNKERILADLQSGEVILLKGGRGGRGNLSFTTAVNQAPSEVQPGEAGKMEELELELKLIADAGLIGFPNVGKSTLISRISAAKPKIADYPFTTLTPNLGVVRYGDGDSFVAADIPGIIERAHEGVGLGIQFLKHIERTRVLVHLIDVSGMSGRDPLEDYYAVNHELKMYEESLLGRPQIVVFNKIDVVDKDRLEELKLIFLKKDIQVHLVSAVTGKGTDKLVEMIGRKVFGE